MALALGTACDAAWRSPALATIPSAGRANHAEGRDPLTSTREAPLVVVDHLGIAVESLGPMLNPEKRDEMASLLQRLVQAAAMRGKTLGQLPRFIRLGHPEGLPELGTPVSPIATRTPNETRDAQHRSLCP